MSVSNTAVISARPAAGVRCLVQRAPRGGLRAWMAWANNNRARWQHRVLRSATGCGHLPVLLPVMLASPNRADGGGQVVSTPTAPQLSGMQQASGSLEVSSCLEVGRQEGLVLRSPTSLMVHSKAKVTPPPQHTYPPCRCYPVHLSKIAIILSQESHAADLVLLKISRPYYQILRLLEQGSTNYKPAREMGDAIQGLITQSSEAPPVMRAQELGQGTWEVGRSAGGLVVPLQPSSP